MAKKPAITKRTVGKAKTVAKAKAHAGLSGLVSDAKTVAKAKGRARLSGLTAEAKRKAKTAAKAKARAPGPPARNASPKLKATPAGTGDKDHLISVIQAGTGASKKAAGETLDALLETVTLSLKKNKKVQLIGFGSFEVVKRKARKGRNPATGEAIRIKASKGVRFRAGTKLKGGI
jgi:DNA-binding protein HU-beta